MKRAYGCWRDDQKRLWLPAPARGIPPKVPVWDLVWPAVEIWLCLLATFRQYRNDSGQSQGILQQQKNALKDRFADIGRQMGGL